MNSEHDLQAERERVERWLDEIDRYVRDELDATARQNLERALEGDAELRAMLDDARVARATLAPARQIRCPEALSRQILAAVDHDVDAAHASRRAPAPRRSHRARLAFGWTTAAAAVLALWAWIGRGAIQTTPTPEPVAYVAVDGTRFSEDEARTASEQMELALSVLNRTMDRTGSLMRSEVSAEFRNHVTAPLQREIGRSIRSIPYLNPQPRGDEHSGTVSPPSVDTPVRSRLLEGAISGERT